MAQRELWETRYAAIVQQYPSVEKLDWDKVFRLDPTVLGRIINDILKIDQAEPGKPGKRPSLDVDRARDRLRQFEGEDYSLEAFPDAFRALTGDRSLRSVARRVGLSHNNIHRLLTGEVSPAPQVMVQIAQAFDRNPSYFQEYRVAAVVGMMLERLSGSPEQSIAIYRRMKAAA